MFLSVNKDMVMAYEGTGVDDTSLEVYYSKNGWISFDERWAYILKRQQKNKLSLT